MPMPVRAKFSRARERLSTAYYMNYWWVGGRPGGVQKMFRIFKDKE